MKARTLYRIAAWVCALCFAGMLLQTVGCAAWNCSSPAFSEEAHGAERRTVIACAGDEWVTSVRLGNG